MFGGNHEKPNKKETEKLLAKSKEVVEPQKKGAWLPGKKFIEQLEEDKEIIFGEFQGAQVPTAGSLTALLHWLILENIGMRKKKKLVILIIFEDPNQLDSFLLAYKCIPITSLELWDKLEGMYNSNFREGR